MNAVQDRFFYSNELSLHLEAPGHPLDLEPGEWP
jgi:hypothetical protein